MVLINHELGFPLVHVKRDYEKDILGFGGQCKLKSVSLDKKSVKTILIRYKVSDVKLHKYILPLVSQNTDQNVLDRHVLLNGSD